MRIAVDFDGTIVEDQYPAIGVEKPFAIKVLKQLAAEGDDIILWTARSGSLLQDAVDWCESRGLKLYAINSNCHRCIAHQGGFKGSRKIKVDIFIDDNNLGGFPGWPRVYAKIARQKSHINGPPSKTLRRRIFGLFYKVSLSARSQICRKQYYMTSIFLNSRRVR